MSEIDFDYLIAPIAQEQFFSEYWEKKPLRLLRQRPDYYSSLVSGSDIDYMLSVASSFETEQVELLGTTKSLSKAAKKMPSAFYNAYREGASLRIRGVNRIWKPIWTLCIAIQELFGFRVAANMYLSPANSHGLDRHYDRHDTVILQIAGSKNWRVFGSPVELPIEHSPLMAFERSEVELHYRGAPQMQEVVENSDSEPLDEFVMHEGDLLYLPRGFIHQAWSTDALSAHVTVGIYPITWVDMISVALGQLGHKDPRFRKALPIGFGKRASDASVEDEFKRLVQAMAQDADVFRAVEEINGSLMLNQQSIGEGSIADARVDTIDIDTRVERRPGLLCRFVVDGDFVRLAACHGDFSMPKFFEQAVRFVSENQHFKVGALPGGLSEHSKITLVRRLIEDGFLRPTRNSH